MKTTTFHASNYGSFAGQIPTDIEGYAHTTQRGWMRAPMDWGTDAPRSYRLERSAELAAETRAAVKAADLALDQWRAANG